MTLKVAGKVARLSGQFKACHDKCDTPASKISADMYMRGRCGQHER